MHVATVASKASSHERTCCDAETSPLSATRSQVFGSAQVNWVTNAGMRCADISYPTKHQFDCQPLTR